MSRSHLGWFVLVLGALTLPSLGGCPPSGTSSDAGGLAALGLPPAATADTDVDGLTTADERAAGTDPTVADCDGDGLVDGVEVNLGTSPLDSDTDGDGLSDGGEVDLGTDPVLADTDGDGLTDGNEVKRRTDPLDLDTDGDGVEDGEEVELGTDPRIRDTDGDGLNDGVEVDLGTDPTDRDTDGDGLYDGTEVLLLLDPLQPTELPFQVNGDWSFVAPGWGTACITIAAEKVAAWDDGCHGNMAPISESQPVTRSGDRLIWTFMTAVPAGPIYMTLDMRGQEDGSMSGSALARSAYGELLTVPDVVMTRR